jgi:cyclophilin family peptidyl-prolyl cis-trans isomerase
MLFKKIFAVTVAIIILAGLIAAQEKPSQKKFDEPKIKKGNPVVIMKTSLGTIKIELFQDKAPISVKNFLTYVDEKYYDNTIFHRVIKGFMIQGGGFTATNPIKQKQTNTPIKNESDNGVKNDRGTLAMARTPDPNSATSQFFINVVDNSFLNRSERDAGYAVFAKVIEGMDIVDKIREVKTGITSDVILPNGKKTPQPFQDVPLTQVVIETVRRSEVKK